MSPLSNVSCSHRDAVAAHENCSLFIDTEGLGACAGMGAGIRSASDTTEPGTVNIGQGQIYFLPGRRRRPETAEPVCWVPWIQRWWLAQRCHAVVGKLIAHVCT